MKKLLIPLIIYILLVIILLIKLDYIHIEIKKKTEEININEYINNGLNLEDETINVSNGKADRFYYSQLNNTAKIMYNKILSEREQMKTGNAEIKFDDHIFDEILNEESGVQNLGKEYQNAVDAIRYDNMDLFYIDFSKTVLRTITFTRGNETRYEVYLSKADGKENYFQDGIKSKEEVDAMLTEINAIKEALLQNISGSKYQQIQYVHNWIIDNTEYDTLYNDNNSRNIYGALLNQSVVCEGYAKTFKYLLDELGITCILVSGEAVNSEGNREKHMWNYVLLNDIWYSVDVTWDDPILQNSNELSDKLRYKYFCQGDNINENHFLEEIITQGCQIWEYPTLYHKDKT